MRRLTVAAVLAALLAAPAVAAPVQVNLGSGSDSSYLRLLLLFASVSLAPAMLAVLTSFARIMVVLLFLRAGLGTVQVIPNPVLIGFAILLTACTMAPTLGAVNERALQPLLAGKADLATAARAAEGPLRGYLASRVRPDDLAVVARPGAPPDQPSLSQLAAAHVLSELRVAFFMGLIIYLPFLVIDLVVAGTLGSLGALSLPQAAVALPFKVLLFLMVDGWRLLTDAIITSLR